MLQVRRSEDRGRADYGWLKAKYSFSFADYYDPQHMGFRKLRVINQDIVAGGGGFPPHGHRDMEIITVVLRGAVQHQDSMGNKTLIPAGEIQAMSAGRGVQHSEMNPSASDDLELLRIWIQPERTGLPPAYEQAKIPKQGEGLIPLAAPYGAEAPVHIHQDVRLYLGRLSDAQTLEHPLDQNRHVWLQLIKGQLRVGELSLKAGDGLAVSQEARLNFQSEGESEFLLFDLN